MLWLDNRNVGQKDVTAASMYLLVYYSARLIIWCWKHKYGIFWFAIYALLSFGSYYLASEALE